MVQEPVSESEKKKEVTVEGPGAKAQTEEQKQMEEENRKMEEEKRKKEETRKEERKKREEKKKEEKKKKAEKKAEWRRRKAEEKKKEEVEGKKRKVETPSEAARTSKRSKRVPDTAPVSKSARNSAVTVTAAGPQTVRLTRSARGRFGTEPEASVTRSVSVPVESEEEVSSEEVNAGIREAPESPKVGPAGTTSLTGVELPPQGPADSVCQLQCHWFAL